MISEELEFAFRDYLTDKRIFVFSQIKDELSDILTENQIKYLLKKYRKAGYVVYDVNSKEYKVVNTNFDSEAMLDDEKAEPQTDTEQNKNVEDGEQKKEDKTEDKKEDTGGVSEMAEKKKVQEEKQKEPPIIQKKMKEIEKKQLTPQQPFVSKQPTADKGVSENKTVSEKKGFNWKYVILTITVGVIAFIAFKLYNSLRGKSVSEKTGKKQKECRECEKKKNQEQQQEDELSKLGFMNADKLF